MSRAGPGAVSTTGAAVGAAVGVGGLGRTTSMVTSSGAAVALNASSSTTSTDRR